MGRSRITPEALSVAVAGPDENFAALSEEEAGRFLAAHLASLPEEDEESSAF
jgi:hypothetical protein